MRRVFVLAPFAAVWLFACSSGDAGGVSSPAIVTSDAGDFDGGDFDAAPSTDGNAEAHADAGPSEAGADAADPNACEWGGAPGECMMKESCAALADHSSYANECPGSADIECCIKTPNVADNPPIPAGYKGMTQSMVTPEMTAWAVMILDDPKTYPMFSTTMKTFGAQLVLARVEWHPPDFQNSVVHRGVTLYVPG